MKMNAVLLSVLGLLALFTYTSAIVCTHDICNGVKCVAVTEETCDGKFVPNGGFCGCCDACRNILKKGEYCGLIFLRGVPPVAECDKGLACNITTKTCEEVVA